MSAQTSPTRASDGRPDDPFNGQCAIDDVPRKYAWDNHTPLEDRIETHYRDNRLPSAADVRGTLKVPSVAAGKGMQQVIENELDDCINASADLDTWEWADRVAQALLAAGYGKVAPGSDEPSRSVSAVELLAALVRLADGPDSAVVTLVDVDMDAVGVGGPTVTETHLSEWIATNGSEILGRPYRGAVTRSVSSPEAAGRDDDITEDWLAEVGFGRRDPGQSEPFAHWIIEFDEHGDHGLYVETTKPGWFNRNGEHINADAGWFLWIGRDSQHIHTRPVFKRSEIIALIEALSGQPWTPEAMKYRRVPVALPPAPEGK